MKLLLDAHVFLWWCEGSEKLSPAAEAALDDPAHQAWVSVASLWEITIKSSLGRLAFEGELADWASRHDIRVLDIRPAHLKALRDVPWLHRDPFDRMLVAQALAEAMVLVTRDGVLQTYPVATLPA